MQLLSALRLLLAKNAFDWVAGLHACPGRFIAEVTIKLILVSLITKYDMKLPDGGPERPVETKRFTHWALDASIPVLVKSVPF
jgi:cytochrome P450